MAAVAATAECGLAIKCDMGTDCVTLPSEGVAHRMGRARRVRPIRCQTGAAGHIFEMAVT